MVNIRSDIILGSLTAVGERGPVPARLPAAWRPGRLGRGRRLWSSWRAS